MLLASLLGPRSRSVAVPHDTNVKRQREEDEGDGRTGRRGEGERKRRLYNIELKKGMGERKQGSRKPRNSTKQLPKTATKRAVAVGSPLSYTRL